MTGQPTSSHIEPADKVDGRRTDTRASMQQIAERLGVTRPALYYHYRSKEDILASIHNDLAYSVDDLITWADTQPKTRRTRLQLLRRLHGLMSGPWGTFTRFAQANEAAMRDLSAA